MPTEPNDVERVALLPCPFCGGEDVVIFYAAIAYAGCAGCGAEGPWHGSDATEQSAITAWNTRAAIAAMGGSNKAVIEQRTAAEWLVWEADEAVHSVPETLRALGLVSPEPTA